METKVLFGTKAGDPDWMERDALLVACRALLAGIDRILASDLPPVCKAVIMSHLRAEESARAAIAMCEPTGATAAEKAIEAMRADLEKKIRQ